MHDARRNKQVVIIGGGITGLSAANRLVELRGETGRQFDITLLEASPRLGGIIKTFEHDGFLIEAGPDSFISEKPEATHLAKRIGLEANLIETNSLHRRSFIVRNGRLRPVPEGFQLLAPSRLWPFVTSDVFSWPGKARMALDLLLPRRQIANGMDDESLADFVRRRLGHEALERMAQPMVGGIYTADPEKLSLRATMPRFLDMEREHGSVIRALLRGSRTTVRAGRARGEVQSGTSGARYSLFLSFDRGMEVLIDRLSEQPIGCRSPAGPSTTGLTVQLKTRTSALEFARQQSTGSGPHWTIRTDSNETIHADAVCFAVPAPVAARLLRNIDSQLAVELESIACASTATINVAYRREDVPHPLDGFGFVVPFIEKRSLIACTFSSIKFPGRAPQDQVLLRAFVGGALQPEMFELAEDELTSSVRHDLRDLLGIEKAPLFSFVTKWRDSMPQYHVGHLERVRRIEERLAALPGLYLAGNAYTGAGIPDCIRSGETAAAQIARSIDFSLRSDIEVTFHTTGGSKEVVNGGLSKGATDAHRDRTAAPPDE